MERKGKIADWVRMLRPNHWIKSGFCLAALFFSGDFLQLENWLEALPLLVAFSLISSAGYIVNDCLNLKEDRLHPRKRKRPIASGTITVGHGLVVAFGLSCVSFGLLAQFYGFGSVFFLALSYLLLTGLYSIVFRSVPVLDVMVISVGFVVRVMSGAYAIDLTPTWWLVGCTYSLALLLGFGKRRGELVLFRKRGDDDNVGTTRKALRGYSFPLLDVLLAVCAFLCVSTYLAFAINRGSFWLGMSGIPVMVGVSDYIRMAWRSEVVERPETLFFRSPVLLGSVGVWLILVTLFV